LFAASTSRISIAGRPVSSTAVARMLAALGANHVAFRIATTLAGANYPGPSLFWYRDMRATLRDPGFPAVAAQLGWKTSRARPDVCNDNAPRPFCRMI